jgi:hypothetical protein
LKKFNKVVAIEVDPQYNVVTKKEWPRGSQVMNGLDEFAEISADHVHTNLNRAIRDLRESLEMVGVEGVVEGEDGIEKMVMPKVIVRLTIRQAQMLNSILAEEGR